MIFYKSSKSGEFLPIGQRGLLFARKRTISVTICNNITYIDDFEDKSKYTIFSTIIKRFSRQALTTSKYTYIYLNVHSLKFQKYDTR